MTGEVGQSEYPSLATAECPYPILEALRGGGGVYKVPDRDEYLVSRHEEIMYATRHPEIFSSATPLNAEAQVGWEASVFSCDPPEHTAKRSIAFQSFNPRRLREYEPMIRGVIDDLIDGFIDDGEVEFVEGFSNRVSSRVMFNLLGLREEDAGWIADITFEGVGARYLPADLREQAERDGERVNEFMTAVVRERAENLGDDVISELIRAHAEPDGEVNMAYIAVESAVLVLGGTLTPAHMMSSAMLLLLQHPDQAALVRADHSLIPRMLEEALRVEAPDQFMPRYTTVDTTLGGVDIPAGSLVMLLYASGNRDESVFGEPESFDVRRENVKKHFSFGGGIHFCLGAPLARLIGTRAYEALFTRLGDIRLAEGRNDFTHLASTFNRAPNAVHIEFDPA